MRPHLTGSVTFALVASEATRRLQTELAILVFKSLRGETPSYFSFVELPCGAPPFPDDKAVNSTIRAGCWAREGVAPSCCEGPGVSTPENF